MSFVDWSFEWLDAEGDRSGTNLVDLETFFNRRPEFHHLIGESTLLNITQVQDAYAGIDVAFAKKKRLPIVVAVRKRVSLVPLLLRSSPRRPPAGKGNAATLDKEALKAFCDDTASYLRGIESEFNVRIVRIGIDAPSSPKTDGALRRECELELDRKRISCIATPSYAEFATIQERASNHLVSCGVESRIPGANQLWMLVGFELFRTLSLFWECLEVFPQATVAGLGASNVHKSHPEGLLGQLKAVSRQTGWPTVPIRESLNNIGFGNYHDRLDAYLSAWVASLDASERIPIGCAPDDVIWVPRLENKNR